MFYKKIYVISILITNNIIYNFYLFGCILFPLFFQEKIITNKQSTDIYHNKLLFILYSEDFYKKYNIDMLKLSDMYFDFINKMNNSNNIIKNNNNNNNDNNNDDDINSIISNSISSSSYSSFSSFSSLNSSFYDDLDQNFDENQNPDFDILVHKEE